jgi:hypothetical protein
LGKVVEVVDDWCTELLGRDVTQECINPADKQEVTQYIESSASEARAVSDTKELLRKARQRLARQVRQQASHQQGYNK